MFAIRISGVATSAEHSLHAEGELLPRGTAGRIRDHLPTPRSLAVVLQQTEWLRLLPWALDSPATAHPQPFGSLWRAPLRMTDSTRPVLSDGQFVWGPNAAGFDPVAYLQARNSPLLPHAEHLALWADYSSVNPQVLLAVLEIQRGWVTSIAPDTTAELIRSEIADTAMDLATAFYEHLHIWGARKPERQAGPQVGPVVVFGDGSAQALDPQTSSANYALATVLGRPTPDLGFTAQAASGGDVAVFPLIFGALFPGVDPLDNSNQITPLAAPAADLLQFPFPLGATWNASGAHSWNGGSYPPPFSSLDFFASGGTCSNPLNLYSVAAAYGSANRPYGYGCWLELNHGGGWVTSYYHLRHLYSGAPLTRNGKVGTIACELCAGGFATGPHVHFSLKYNGAYVSLEGVKLSGWTVRVGTVPYYSGSLQRGGITLNPYSAVNNDYQSYFSQGPRSLRFYGTGSGDVDRVKIRMTDLSSGPPVNIGAQDFTLEWWMRALPGENQAPAVACGAGDGWRRGNVVLDRDRFGQDRDYGVSLANGRLAFGVGGEASGQLTLCGTTDVTDGKWHHVAVQRRRADGWLWLFVDGILQAQGDGPDGDISYPRDAVISDGCGGPCVNDPFLVLGAEKHGVDPSLRSFSGWLDELRISNVLRYSGAFSPPTQAFVTDGNTVTLLHMDDSPGTQAYDTSGFIGGPSNGALKVGGSLAGPAWSTEIPFTVGTPTPSPTPSHTPTPSLTPSLTPSSTPTLTPTHTTAPSATPTPSSTPSPTSSSTPTPTATPSSTPTPTATPSSTPTPTATPSSTPSPTHTATASSTPTVTSSPTPSGSPLPTDINRDGRVDVLDVQLCVNVVLGLETDPAIVARADVNGDGLVNVLDVQTVINAFLAG